MPTDIVFIHSGLGNQMFQYALYLQLKALGKNVAISESYYIVEKCGIVIYSFKRIFTISKKEKR